MKTPYFAFYPKDWLSDPKVKQLTYEERGIYFDLLCHSWDFVDGSCSLPNDDEFISRLLNIRLTKWKKIRKILIEGIVPVFQIDKSNRIINSRLQKEFKKAKEKSKNNSASVNKRWNNQNKVLEGNSLENNESSHTNVYTNVEETNNVRNTILDIDKEKEKINKKKKKVIHTSFNQTWKLVIDHAKKFGASEIPTFDDPSIMPAIRAAGGWRAICHANPFELSRLKREFRQAYAAQNEQAKRKISDAESEASSLKNMSALENSAERAKVDRSVPMRAIPPPGDLSR